METKNYLNILLNMLDVKNENDAHKFHSIIDDLLKKKNAKGLFR